MTLREKEGRLAGAALFIFFQELVRWMATQSLSWLENKGF